MQKNKLLWFILAFISIPALSMQNISELQRAKNQANEKIESKLAELEKNRFFKYENIFFYIYGELYNSLISLQEFIELGVRSNEDDDSIERKRMNRYLEEIMAGRAILRKEFNIINTSFGRQQKKGFRFFSKTNKKAKSHEKSLIMKKRLADIALLINSEQALQTINKNIADISNEQRAQELLNKVSNDLKNLFTWPHDLIEAMEKFGQDFGIKVFIKFNFLQVRELIIQMQKIIKSEKQITAQKIISSKINFIRWSENSQRLKYLKEIVDIIDKNIDKIFSDSDINYLLKKIKSLLRNVSERPDDLEKILARLEIFLPIKLTFAQTKEKIISIKKFCEKQSEELVTGISNEKLSKHKSRFLISEYSDMLKKHKDVIKFINENYDSAYEPQSATSLLKRSQSKVSWANDDDDELIRLGLIEPPSAYWQTLQNGFIKTLLVSAIASPIVQGINTYNWAVSNRPQGFEGDECENFRQKHKSFRQAARKFHPDKKCGAIYGDEKNTCYVDAANKFQMAVECFGKNKKPVSSASFSGGEFIGY